MQHLEQILRDRLMPWLEPGVSDHIIVARSRMSTTIEHPGVKVTYRKMKGQRTVIKNKRLYNNARYINAKWIEDDMDEAVIPRFIYVVEGEVNFRVGNYMLQCTKGDFVLVPPKIPLYGGESSPDVVGIPNTSALLLWMLPYPRAFQCWLHGFGNFQSGEANENYLFTSLPLITMFELLLEEAQQKKDRVICDHLLVATMRTLLREVENKHYLHPGPTISEDAPHATEGEFIQQVRGYIEAHVSEHLTLETVARQLYISRTHLVRRMRQETNQTFVEFLTDCRLREAKKLLIESDWAVLVIGEFVGFKSAAYFHRIFLREVGCTPKQYRFRERNSQ